MLNSIGSKKGSISIVTLVVLVLFITGLALFTFNSVNNKLFSKVSDSFEVQDVLIQEKEISFFAKRFLEESLVESYLNITKEGSFILNPSNLEVSKENLDLILNEEVRNSFVTNSGLSLMEGYNGVLSERKREIEFSYSENKASLLLKDVELENRKDGDILLKVKYETEIEVETSLKEVGLESFERIFEVKEECKSVNILSENANAITELQECFDENLRYFVSNAERKDVTEEDSEGYMFIKLESKNKILSKNKFEKISLDFKFE